VLADLLTPISTFMKLAKNSDYAFILESVEGGEQYARYSFIGCNPKQIIKSENNKVFTKSVGDWEGVEDDFLPFIRNIHKSYHTPKLDNLPSFTGGLVGYLGYESITWIEDIPIHEGDELEAPDAVFMLFEELIAFDHLKNQIILFSNVQIKDDSNLESDYEMALQKIDRMGEDLHEDIDYQTPEVTRGSILESNFSQQDFEKAVLVAQEHIKSLT
jgi:anthranilate synthase component 1